MGGIDRDQIVEGWRIWEGGKGKMEVEGSGGRGQEEEEEEEER